MQVKHSHTVQVLKVLSGIGCDEPASAIEGDLAIKTSLTRSEIVKSTTCGANKAREALSALRDADIVVVDRCSSNGETRYTINPAKLGGVLEMVN